MRRNQGIAVVALALGFCGMIFSSNMWFIYFGFKPVVKVSLFNDLVVPMTVFILSAMVTLYGLHLADKEKTNGKRER